MLELNKIYNMDCLKGSKQLPDKSITRLAGRSSLDTVDR